MVKHAPVNAPFIYQRLPCNRGYSAVAMEKAYEAAVTGTMSVRRAAEEFGVRNSTKLASSSSER